MTDPSARCHGQKSMRFGAALMWLADIFNHWHLYCRDKVTGVYPLWNKEGLDLQPVSTHFYRMQNWHADIAIYLIFLGHLPLIHFMVRYPCAHEIFWSRFMLREIPELQNGQVRSELRAFCSKHSIQGLCYWWNPVNIFDTEQNMLSPPGWRLHGQVLGMEVMQHLAAPAQGSLSAADTGFSFANWQTSSWMPGWTWLQTALDMKASIEVGIRHLWPL